MYPKPKKHKKRAKNNPRPTENDLCKYHNTPFAQTHEVFEGTGQRQLSIKYGMQVKLCNECHRDIQTHPLQGRDLALKQEFQNRFEQEHTRQDFIRLFGRNYLEDEV
jgi:hypothetical protein